MKQGEIRDLTHHEHRMTVVVLSADSWNIALPPLVAPLRRGLESGDFFPAVVTLHDTDPYGGGIDLTDLGTVPAEALGSTVHGMIGGQTMQKLRAAIATIIEG